MTNLYRTALGHHIGGQYRIKVIFRDIQGNTKAAYWMDKNTYNAFSIQDRNTTIDDFRKYGEVFEAEDLDIYSHF